MNIVGVTRVFNEDDIIEAVIRHNYSMLDYIIVLDDGSTDDTRIIIDNLKNEGMKIKIIKNESFIFDESNRNTFLYEMAKSEFNAEWVVFFDADEFIDDSGQSGGIRKYLQSVPKEFDGIFVNMVNYHSISTDDYTDTIVPSRMKWRDKDFCNVYKIILRGDIQGVIKIDHGNHNAFSNGKFVNALMSESIFICHYPSRSGWQNISKSVIGRIKINSAGKNQVRQDIGSHYIGILNAVINSPENLENNVHIFHEKPNFNTMIEHEMIYKGGDLKYTTIPNYKSKCIRNMVTYFIEFSKFFGNMMDNNEIVRKYVYSLNEPDH